ncbi:hypothetical protein VQY18_04025 [Mycoplasma feriruminatoris]|uniref:Uncharacterized protein n=1 Tax=Mycoplasma feriruminatoris TaxID=1179777 RepID=A0A654ITB7_9MOLU|nr:hypothetical protein MF5583_00813 [Mycoplasma feriruminatoris]
MSISLIKIKFENEIDQLIKYLDPIWTKELVFKKLEHFQNTMFKTAPFFNFNQLKILFNLMLIDNEFQNKINSKILNIVFNKEVLEWSFLDDLIKFYTLVLTYDDVWQEDLISSFAIKNNIINVDNFFKDYLSENQLKGVDIQKEYIKQNLNDLDIQKQLLKQLEDSDYDFLTIDLNTLTITNKINVSDINFMYKDYVINEYIKQLKY